MIKIDTSAERDKESAWRSSVVTVIILVDECVVGQMIVVVVHVPGNAGYVLVGGGYSGSLLEIRHLVDDGYIANGWPSAAPTVFGYMSHWCLSLGQQFRSSQHDEDSTRRSGQHDRQHAHHQHHTGVVLCLLILRVVAHSHVKGCWS